MNAVPPGPQDPATQRVEAEKAQLAALATEPEMEIIGVTSLMGAGAMGSPATASGPCGYRCCAGARWRARAEVAS